MMTITHLIEKKITKEKKLQKRTKWEFCSFKVQKLSENRYQKGKQ